MLEGVPREQQILQGHLPRVTYHQVYWYSKIQSVGFSAGGVVCVLKFRVRGSGFRVWGVGCGVQGSASRVQKSEFKVQGAGCKALDQGAGGS